MNGLAVICYFPLNKILKGSMKINMVETGFLKENRTLLTVFVGEKIKYEGSSHQINYLKFFSFCFLFGRKIVLGYQWGICRRKRSLPEQQRLLSKLPVSEKFSYHYPSFTLEKLRWLITNLNWLSDFLSIRCIMNLHSQ